MTPPPESSEEPKPPPQNQELKEGFGALVGHSSRPIPSIAETEAMKRPSDSNFNLAEDKARLKMDIGTAQEQLKTLEQLAEANRQLEAAQKQIAAKDEALKLLMKAYKDFVWDERSDDLEKDILDPNYQDCPSIMAYKLAKSALQHDNRPS